MARKPQSFIPEKAKLFRPDVETRRAQLTQSREQLRQRGYEAEINLELLAVQEAEGAESDGLPEAQRKLENTRDNAYKAARRIDELLAALPQPKKKA